MPDDTPDPAPWPIARVRRAVAALPRRVRVIAAAAAIVLAAGAAIGWVIARPDPGAAPIGDKTLGEPEPEPSPSGDEDAAGAPTVPTTDDAPKWTFEDDFDPDVFKVGDGFLIADKYEMTYVNAKGHKVWSRESSEADGSERYRSNDDVVVVTAGKDGDPHADARATTVLRASTGRKLWTDSTATSVTVTRDAVYLAVCPDPSHGAGDCRLSAREPGSGAARWTVPVLKAAEIVDTSPDGKHLVVEATTDRRGQRRISVLDAATGRDTGAGFDGQEISLTTDKVLVRASGDDDPSDGCTATLTARALDSGERRWKRTVGVPEAADGSDCLGLPDTPGEGNRIAVSTKHGRPEVLDLDSGKIVWTAPSRAVPFTATGNLLVAKVSGGSTDRLVGYDTDSGRRLWTATTDPLESARLSFAAKYLLVNTGNLSDCWVAVSRTTGKATSYPGPCAGGGRDWVAAEPNDSDAGSPNAVAVYPLK